MVREAPQQDAIICGEVRSGERIRLLAVAGSYYKLKLTRGDCDGNLGFVRRGEPGVRLLRSKPKPKPVYTPPVQPEDAGDTPEQKPQAQAKPEGKNVWEDRFGMESRFFVGGLGGISFGLQALTDTSFLAGLEVGYIPTVKQPFVLSLRSNYVSSGNIDVSDTTSLDVQLISAALSGQYWFGLGEEAPYFIVGRLDVGGAFAFGSFATGLEDIFDSSILVRPALGFGFRTGGSNLTYIVESGFNYMPLGFGFNAATLDFALSLQYWL